MRCYGHRYGYYRYCCRRGIGAAAGGGDTGAAAAVAGWLGSSLPCTLLHASDVCQSRDMVQGDSAGLVYSGGKVLGPLVMCCGGFCMSCLLSGLSGRSIEGPMTFFQL